MSKVYMGAGFPGSGKTTLLRPFAEENHFVYICPDDIRLELTGSATDQTRNKEVWGLAKQRLINYINQGKNVVFDATFINKKVRQDFINFLKQDVHPEEICGIVLDVSIETAKERNMERSDKVVPEEAYERMQKYASVPELTEGFSAIVHIDTTGKITKIFGQPLKEGIDLYGEVYKSIQNRK